MNHSTGTPRVAARSDAEARPSVADAAVTSPEDEKTLLGIRQARDLLLGKNRELIEGIARAEDQIAELTYQRDDLLAERDAATTMVARLTAENADLRALVETLGAQQTAGQESEEAIHLARAASEEQVLAIAKERDTAVEAARMSAIDLEQIRGELAAERAGTEERLSATVARFEETARQLTAAKEMHERSVAQEKRHAEELAQQVAAAERARDESRRETAQIAAARSTLERRAAEEQTALKAQISALEKMLKTSLSESPAAPAAPATTTPEKPSPAPAQPHPTQAASPASPAPLTALPTDHELRDSIRDIHDRFTAAKTHPDSLEPLAALGASLVSLAERSQNCGLDLVHHMTSAASELARRVHTAPAKFPLVAPVFEDAIEMLGWLGLHGRAEMIHLAGALVYAVDDDVDNCECLAMAFEKVDLQTRYSVTPIAAAEQIAAHPCELIILDVDLPGMDGFELHSRIRQLPQHTATPVIFLSGHLSTGDRLKTLGGGNNHFIAKPYNLSEISLRVLTLIVQARLA